jgi:beta-lactamase superfamily II metal-dependent hydrolase
MGNDLRRSILSALVIAAILILVAGTAFITLNGSNPTVPGVPTQLQAVPGDGRVSLTWVAPVQDGGSAIDHYLIDIVGTDATAGTTGTSYVVSGLTNGHSYSFQVRAHNSVGLSAPSNTVSATPTATPPPTSNAIVSFIDVGQGDSILIETSDSKHILIDAGPESADTTVVSYLQGRSVTVLDALIATHPDADHIGGADEVLAAFQVLRVYHPGFVKDTQAYTNFIAAVNAEGCPVYTDAQIDPGDTLPLSSTVTFQVLSIDANAPDSNSASIVLKMTYGTVDFIFEGDAPSSVENTIMANPIFNLDIEILKISHHGSSSSTSDAWLTETSPNIGVISVGPNSYGHPASDTLSRLSSHSVQVYRTDTDGTIAISTNGTSWTVT